jgi:peptide/nickel transport system permease protein
MFQRLEYLVLPTFILATQGIGGYSRYMRAAMLDVVAQDYVRTARAKGLTERQVWFKHGARNALIPIATFIGPAITGLLGGAVITETIFNWPGVGRTTVAAVVGRDYPMVMAVTVYVGLATILGYLLSDVLYGLIDPRIRFN